MTLSDEASERLADIVELQPTKNADLQERWGLEDGSAVHGYLESELSEYYYRDDDSLICATPEAEVLVGDSEPGGPRTLQVEGLERQVLEALPAPDEQPQSVVATLQAVRAEGGDPEVDAVRSRLHALVDRGLVERVRRTVPTFRLALEPDRIEFEEPPEQTSNG
jgi:hypothetical protein